MNNSVLKIEEYESTVKDPKLTLGINREIFRDAIQGGLSQYKNTSEFHPITAAGSRAWEEIVAIFRASVVDQHKGWKKLQQSGMPILVNKDLALTIVITSGDEYTGVSDFIPKTRNAKGEETQSFVGKNHDLFDNGFGEESPQPIDKHETWVFLYTIDKSKLEVRYELSLPTKTSISGNKGKVKISDWSSRTIFPSIPFNDEATLLSPNEFVEDSDFFSIVKKQ